jgi:hypothetical protein
MQTTKKLRTMAPRQTAELMLERYGLPNEASAGHLIWHNMPPWKRIVLSSDQIPHDFPTAHTDFLAQYIDYRVPAERAADVLAFHGSIIIDRTAGEVGARCGMEHTERLLFAVPAGGTADPDKPMIAASLARRIIKKGKRLVRGDKP